MVMKKLIPLLIFITTQSCLFSQVSTVRQVFNYAVGDSFEYSYSANDVVGCSAGYILSVITSVTASGDTITYGYDSWQNNLGLCHSVDGSSAACPWGTQNCNGNGQFQVHNLDSLLFNWYGVDAYAYSTNYTPCTSPQCSDSSAYTSDYNGRKQSIIVAHELNTIDETYVDSVGLALRADFIESYNEWVYDTLIYYSKSSRHETWGRYSSINLAASVQDIKQINSGIFPNPASSDFTFSVSELSDPPMQLVLFDITGKEIKRAAIKTLQTELSCAGISPGIYCWQLTSAEKVLGRGKLVVL
jgi:hypothetical protein